MKRHTIDIENLTFDENIVDVRSPSEYAQDHIPGALNLPVLNDEERNIVGWTYKNKSPFEAKRMGAAIVAKNIAIHIDGPLKNKSKNWAPIIYCWRGGQRSGSMGTIFRQIGWPARQLKGGYKSFRRMVVRDLESLSMSLNYTVICGLTGTGKTELLQKLNDLGGQTLDLESVASHRGSLLGEDPKNVQPSQKQFETQIWSRLRQLDYTQTVFVESESKKIGDVRLPKALMDRIRSSECIYISGKQEVRIERILRDYEHLLGKPESVRKALSKLRERHGNSVIDKWFDLIQSKNWSTLVSQLLELHYDPSYKKSLMTNFSKIKKSKVFDFHSNSKKSLNDLAKTILTEYTQP